MSVFHHCLSASQRIAADDRHATLLPSDDLRARMLLHAIGAGRRGAEPAATTQAILTGWQWLGRAPVAERQALQAALREAIARGQTTVRAWLPVAVTETDPCLLATAVAGYIGVAPRSVDARRHALDDVIEWFRRDLTLDRVAVFCALLSLQESSVNARLAELRGRLTDGEIARVRRQFEGATDIPTQEFLADWHGASASAPRQPD